MNNKIILESLSMDLLRVARGLHRGSYSMADRFTQEALQRRREIDENAIKSYFKKTLAGMEHSLSLSDPEKKAEDALMYSTIIRNYSQSFC